MEWAPLRLGIMDVSAERRKRVIDVRSGGEHEVGNKSEEDYQLQSKSMTLLDKRLNVTARLAP